MNARRLYSTECDPRGKMSSGLSQANFERGDSGDVRGESGTIVDGGRRRDAWR